MWQPVAPAAGYSVPHLAGATLAVQRVPQRLQPTSDLVFAGAGQSCVLQ